MRARVLAPGLALAGAFLASGCGSDGTSTVTVTGGADGTVAVDTTAEAPRTETSPTRTTPRPPTTTTVVRTTTRSTTTTRTVRRPAPVSRPRSTTPTPASDPDPLGGTVPSSGRVDGTGYSVEVPAGWNDGSRRFEGDPSAFDINLVKRPGVVVTSSIFTDLTTPPTGADAPGASISQFAGDVRQDIEDRAPTARIVRAADLTVDGEEAIAFTVRRTVRGTIRLRQRQIAMLRGRDLVVVRLTSPIADVAKDGRVFARFLASWRWN